MHINIALKQLILCRLYIEAPLVLQSPEQLTQYPDVFHPVYSCCSAIMRKAIKPSQTSTLFQLKKNPTTFFSDIWLSAVTSYIYATSSKNRQHVCTDICGKLSLTLVMRVLHLIFILPLRTLFPLDLTFVWYLVACVFCVITRHNTCFNCYRKWGCRLQRAQSRVSYVDP